MYNDILGEKEKELPEITKDSIIDAQRDNINSKQELIEKLLNRITALEIELESNERI